jgi:DNA repair exonuclease SbcCD nuclease subunit
MPKTLIWGDAHIHPHKHCSERLQHCLDALEWVFQVAEENNVKHLLFLGDLFHERQKIDVLTYQKTFEIFEKYLGKLGLQVFLLLGNHDLWHLQKWDISSVFPLRSIPGVTVVDRPCTLDVAGRPVSFLPYTHNPALDLARIKNKADFRLLCGHVAIDGAMWNVMHNIRSEVHIEHDGDMTKVGAAVFDGWDQVFLGHYHAQQKLAENVEYIGSPLQLSFGEAFQHKHILIYDLDTHEKTYVRNNFSPQHFIIPQKDLDKYELKGNFIEVIVDDIAKSDVAELRSGILKSNEVGSLTIKQAEKVAPGDERMVEDAKEILTKQSEMVEKWVKVQKDGAGLGELDETKLLEIGHLICQCGGEEES